MYEEEDSNFSSLSQRHAHHQRFHSSAAAFDGRMRGYFSSQLELREALAGRLGAMPGQPMNPSMYGMQQGMFTPGFYQSYGMNPLTPGMPMTYAENLYQSPKMGYFGNQQLVGHNPSQYLPIQHPPRSLQQIPHNPRMAQNMGIGMNQQWQYLQQTGGQSVVNGGNPMYMRPEMNLKVQTSPIEAARAVEGVQREIRARRTVEEAMQKAAKDNMERLKTLSNASNSPASTPKTEPAATPKAAIKLEDDASSPMKGPQSSSDAASEKALLVSEHHDIPISQPQPTTFGPFTTQLPAEVLQYNIDELNGDMGDAMAYQEFEPSEDVNSTEPFPISATDDGIDFINPFQSDSQLNADGSYDWASFSAGAASVNFDSFFMGSGATEANTLLTA